MEELVQKSIDRQAQVENGTYNKPNSSPVPNVHQTMAGRRRFYKHVGFEEIPNTNGQVCYSCNTVAVLIESLSIK